MVKPHKPLKIGVLPGDGIGAEVMAAALPVFSALNLPITLNYGDIGWASWQQKGNPIPEETWKLINTSDTLLLGAITSKPPREAQQELAAELKEQKLAYTSPLVLLRQNLDLYANVRPCFSLKESENPFNFCIIRENTEGLYAGFDYHPLPQALVELLATHPRWQKIPAAELSCTLRLQSTAGLTRLFHFAFRYALEHKMQRVTLADKSNVLRASGQFTREIFEDVARHYPEIHADILNVDALALWLIRRPQEFGVIVAENMFGDILSDVGAGVMGGLGFAPSANIGDHKCYFEPVHGSAPRLAPGKANPSAMFLTISLLLHHFGYHHEAELILDAVRTVVNTGRFITYDLKGKASTQEMAQAIIAECLRAKSTTSGIQNASEGKEMTTLLAQLSLYNSTEISDALDGCGVEGALLHIKPLAPGMKLVGPAYTLQYASYDKPSATFKNAADYIDSVPAHSVLVIDNKGRIDCTVWGAILTKMALQKNINGTVVNGAVRDVDFIRTINYPLFCINTYMRSGKNRVYKLNEQATLEINGVCIHPGDIIFGDDNGVLVLPRNLLPEIVKKAELIKQTEERIGKAIQEGSTLKQARRDYRYDQPWLGAKKNGE